MPKQITDFEKALMDGDNMTPEEAANALKEAREYVAELFDDADGEDGFSLHEDVQSYLQDEWELEPDYILDLIPEMFGE